MPERGELFFFRVGIDEIGHPIQHVWHHVHHPVRRGAGRLGKGQNPHIAVLHDEKGHRNDLYAAARTAATRDELILAVKSKRYTYARLSRIATNALLGVTADFARANSRPTYARVLGFRKNAQPLLSEIKRRGTLPLVTRIAGIDDPLLALDVRAQDLWALGCQNPALRAAGQDYTAGPVIA